MNQSVTNSSLNRVAFVGNYLPRQCGIATFTTDICEAVALPVNNRVEGYAYPTRMGFELAALSDRFVVMSDRGSEYLQQISPVAPEKVDLIPHGIPDVPFVNSSFHKDLFGVEGKTVILSSGLLSANKGIETVMAALPAIIERYPELVYIVAGGTDPHVIATPCWCAQEMLADRWGVLVPFGDPAALADQVIKLLGNEAERQAMRKRACMFGRGMICPEVAKRHLRTFECARSERRHYISPGLPAKAPDKYPSELPPFNAEHLRAMTDETRMLQHALFSVPNYAHGYTTDDNARALLVSVLLNELGYSESTGMASRYLSFLGFAFNPQNRRFRDVMDYQRQWLEESGSDDSHGRALWALGTVLSHATTTSFNSMAGWLFEQALPSILETTSSRAWAFALIGIAEYVEKLSGDRMANRVRDELATRLLGLFERHRTDDWCWFEPRLTYCNAALSHALLVCGRSIPDSTMTDAGLESLAWLADLQHANEGHFVPIGSNGFHHSGRERARFDQQPVEAQAMVSACLEAYRITRDRKWNREARQAFEWFLGRNDLQRPLYDATTGGCRDGLHPDGPDENQGAESTLAFLQSLLELRLEEQAHLSMEALLQRTIST